MSPRVSGGRFAALLLAAALTTVVSAQQNKLKAIKPGWNMFSKDQDVQLGQEAAAQIEKQVQVVNNQDLSAYIERIGKKLAAQPEADKYPYSFKVVNDPSINAFALPGGPTFVHTGLIASADNEAQMAGVVAHEIAHVALRHGTHQATKAQFIQLGAAAVGGVSSGGMLGQLAQLGIGLGANSLLLKYSRDAERDADLVGARMMAKAGYNPIEMAKFFEKLEAEDRKRGGGTMQFFSDHPNPGNRVTYVTAEAKLIGGGNLTTGDVTELKRMQQVVATIPPPPKKPAAAAGNAAGTTAGTAGGAAAPGSAPGRLENARPSARFNQFSGRVFSMSIPDNWQATEAPQGVNVAVGNQAGIAKGAQGVEVSYGVLVEAAQPQKTPINLEQETDVLLQRFQQQGLKDSGQGKRLTVGGQPALLNVMTSQSAFGGQREVDAILSTVRPEGILYFVFIAPEGDYAGAQKIFDQMIQSIRFPR